MAENAEAVEDDDFDKAFAELADEREGTETATINDDAGTGGKPNADDGLEGTAAGNDDGTVTAEEQAAADAAVQAEADKFEGWPQGAIDAYKDQEKKVSDLDHRIKSDNGRVGAFQRKINNLETQIATIQKAPGQPSTADITAAMGTDKDWTEFSKEYPEVAAAIDGRLTGFSKQVDTTVDTKLAPVVQKQVENQQHEAYDEVSQDFPTWQEAVKTQDFNDFMAIQSPGIQALAGSDDTNDASTLIGMFDDYRVSKGMETLRTDPKPDNGGSVDNKADEIAARRQRQLQDGVTIPSKNARIDPNAESGSEYENAFAAFAARKEANRQ